MTKTLPSLTKLTAGHLSFEFTQTFIFLQAFTIIDFTIADVQHIFVSSSQTPILAPFLSQLQHLHLAELAKVLKVYTGIWQKVFPG